MKLAREYVSSFKIQIILHTTNKILAKVIIMAPTALLRKLAHCPMFKLSISGQIYSVRSIFQGQFSYSFFFWKKALFLIVTSHLEAGRIISSFAQFCRQAERLCTVYSVHTALCSWDPLKKSPCSWDYWHSSSIT